MQANSASPLEFALAAHNVQFLRDAQNIQIADSGLILRTEAIERTRTETSVTVQLNVTASSNRLGDVPVMECFAGIGPDVAAAEKDAFVKFMLGSMHVLLTGLTEHRCAEDSTEVSDWHGQGAAWKVFSGSYISHGGDTGQIPYPGLFRQLKQLFESTVEPGPHWVSVFYASLNGSTIGVEVTINNERWLEAEAIASQWNWQVQSGYASIRHFFLALEDNVA